MHWQRPDKLFTEIPMHRIVKIESFGHTGWLPEGEVYIDAGNGIDATRANRAFLARVARGNASRVGKQPVGSAFSGDEPLPADSARLLRVQEGNEEAGSGGGGAQVRSGHSIADAAERGYDPTDAEVVAGMQRILAKMKRTTSLLGGK